MSFAGDAFYLALRPTRQHAALLILVHCIAFLAVLLSGVWSVAQASVLAMVIITSGIYRVYRFGMLRHPASVLGINYYRGAWRLHLADGRVLDATLVPQLVLSRWFIVLHFRIGAPGFFSRLGRTGAGGVFSRLGNSGLFTKNRSGLFVVIANDSLDKDSLRRCRVFFRFAQLGP